MLVFPPFVAGIVAVIVWVLLTGGLHLDGLADCCDGLLASASVERRLEIMKDPHIGAFGVIGLVLVLFFKAATLASLTSDSSLGILLAASLARWCILPAALLPLARPNGMAADFVLGFQRFYILSGAAIPMLITIILGGRGFLSAFVGLTAAASVLLLARSRIGGITGDVFGMIIEIVETAVLLAFLIGE
jgi:adenosylcobinamide-GDP ribazoletransferase